MPTGRVEASTSSLSFESRRTDEGVGARGAFGENADVFDHVDITVSDLAASRAFYHEALGLPSVEGEWIEWGDFGIQPVDEDHPATRNLHIGFALADRDAVDAWWNRLTEAGYRSDGEPGPRPRYSDSYYGAFILDPDGNSVEAVHHDRVRPGEIDHLWLRTADVAASKAFYATVAPVVDIRLAVDQPGQVSWRFNDESGGFTFVTGTNATEHVHLAFGVSDFETVKRFYGVAIGAGYRDNGAPGERPQYHPGYYGAFVRDPDSHNVEAVFHDRANSTNERN
jgi:catechol 2,3-dioxygenase-like lactoylglutathione lyase family enzyme